MDQPTEQLNAVMEERGLRPTRQRREVFDALLLRRDHPTATEVFLRVKSEMPTISLATVYNCLEALVDCGLVRQVNVDRSPTRYCPNLEDHGHFHCDRCGHVFDVDLEAVQSAPDRVWNLPPGYAITTQEVTLRGLCPTCTSHS